MRTISILTIALLLTAPACMANIDGSWTATPKDDGRIQLNLAHDSNSHSGSRFAIADFTGLTAAQVRATAQTPVQFELRREAGTISFDGTFRNNFGAGQFTFVPSRAYYASIRALGVDTRDRDDDEETIFALAMHDVSSAYIKSMIAEGYRVDLDKYLAFRIFHITPQLVAEFRDLGFRNIDADDLIATQVHKVTPQYVRELRAAGFTNLSLDELVAFRIHKVTPEFVAEVHKLGYTNVSGDDLVAMRIHKVTPEFIREIEAAGYEHVPIDKLIAMKIHGIDAAYVKKMNGLK